MRLSFRRCRLRIRAGTPKTETVGPDRLEEVVGATRRAQVIRSIAPRGTQQYMLTISIINTFASVRFIERIRFEKAAAPLPHVATHIQGINPRCTCRPYSIAHNSSLAAAVFAPAAVLRHKRIAPGINPIFWPPCSPFPFCLGGQSAIPPAAVGVGFKPCHADARLLWVNKIIIIPWARLFRFLYPLPTPNG